jgi:NAD(P)-dependent dehydrogenase (short-subunit alcohol dehydrogenase family)
MSTAEAVGKVHFDFRGARVLVTGGTRGIGRAIAGGFHAAGAEVLVTGSSEDPSVYEPLPAGTAYRRLRLAERSDIAALAAEIPQLDVLVNNAGGTGGASTPHDFDTAVDINLNAVFHLSRALVPALGGSRLRGGAAIVNLASEMSLFGSPYFYGYGAAKAAIVQLTRSFCVELGAQGVRVNAVLPGSIPTPMTQAFADDPGVHQMVSQATPMARWGEAQEIADAVLYLCSPAASFVTGHTLVVDGGYSVMK